MAHSDKLIQLLKSDETESREEHNWYCKITIQTSFTNGGFPTKWGFQKNLN